MSWVSSLWSKYHYYNDSIFIYKVYMEQYNSSTWLPLLSVVSHWFWGMDIHSLQPRCSVYISHHYRVFILPQISILSAVLYCLCLSRFLSILRVYFGGRFIWRSYVVDAQYFKTFVWQLLEWRLVSGASSNCALNVSNIDYDTPIYGCTEHNTGISLCHWHLPTSCLIWVYT